MSTRLALQATKQGRSARRGRMAASWAGLDIGMIGHYPQWSVHVVAPYYSGSNPRTTGDATTRTGATQRRLANQIWPHGGTVEPQWRDRGAGVSMWARGAARHDHDLAAGALVALS